jgi:glycerol-3-phosphate acyltransferase PlsY
MSPAWEVGILIPVAYCLGSIPFGLLVGLSRGVDPRTQGSGNIGATNLGRILGGRFFALVFSLDLLKGLLPVLVAGWLLGWKATSVANCLLWMGVGVAAILGHLFSLFLKFKGGKGVATSTGVALGLYPYYTIPALIAAAVFLLAFKAWRYVSLASMVGALAFALAYIVLGVALGWPILSSQLPLLIFVLAICCMIIWKHRSNLARLAARTENRFASTKK